MESLAPPNSSWYSEASKMSNSPVKDTPHDVVLAVGDLKKAFGWVVGILVTLLLIRDGYNQTRMVKLEEHASRNDIALSAVSEKLGFYKEQLGSIQTSIEASQHNQSEIIVQLSAMRASGAATEEIARSTQSRVERLAEFISRSSKVSNSGADSFDTIGRRTKQESP